MADRAIGVVLEAGTGVERFVLAKERGEPGGDEMDGGADGPDVGGHIVGWELWRLKHGRAGDAILRGDEGGGGEAKVGEDGVGVAGLAGGVSEENIIGFDIAVDDRLPEAWWGPVWAGAVDTGVDVCYRGSELDEDVPDE